MSYLPAQYVPSRKASTITQVILALPQFEGECWITVIQWANSCQGCEHVDWPSGHWSIFSCAVDCSIHYLIFYTAHHLGHLIYSLCRYHCSVPLAIVYSPDIIYLPNRVFHAVFKRLCICHSYNYPPQILCCPVPYLLALPSTNFVLSGARMLASLCPGHCFNSSPHNFYLSSALPTPAWAIFSLPCECTVLGKCSCLHWYCM
jgi:hypothetical protein